MRDIRFRALYQPRKNSKQSRIVNIKQLHFGFGNTLIEAECWWKENRKTITKWIGGTKLTLMRYTGLKDKNGKEIYAQDQVLWDGGQYEVVFSEIEGAWILKDDREDWECPSLYGVRSEKQSRLEIIGNIYSNPELLEKGD